MSETPNKATIYLAFKGLNAPVAIADCPELLPVFAEVLPRWCFRASYACHIDPCATIRRVGEGRYLCEVDGEGTANHEWDSVNAVCETVAELAWEHVRSRPDWLCLHCAAVEFAGRLVIFPNSKRAGKSTLTAVLARRGKMVFTDDFLPVSIADDQRLIGRANGVLPRIRLPVPGDLGQPFLQWVADNRGPANDRYKYLRVPSLAEQGQELPIGAVVLLNRDDTSPPDIADCSKTETLDAMIAQNFARTVHAGRILEASLGVIETADLYRLSYRSANEAAALLEQTFAKWERPVQRLLTRHPVQAVSADLEKLDETPPKLDRDRAYRQAEGVAEVVIDDTAYLADKSGIGLFKLNETSRAIWFQMAEPVTHLELTGLFEQAFPAVSADQIRRDTLSVFEKFAESRLIVPSEPLQDRCPS